MNGVKIIKERKEKKITTLNNDKKKKRYSKGEWKIPHSTLGDLAQ